MLMIMGAMAGVSIVLFWFVAGSISTPVSRLCEAARGIGEKKFKKVETGTNVKELYELENEINQMQDNLLKADEAERVFFQNASHELRTPLMSISGYAQGIQRGVFEDVSQAAGVILDERQPATEVVDGILTLTRMDQMRYQVVPVELGIREYIEDQIERLEGLAYQKKIKLEFLPGDEHKIISDVMLLGRAFSNVTSNCIRYAKEMVWISVEENGEQLKTRSGTTGRESWKTIFLICLIAFIKGRTEITGWGFPSQNAPWSTWEAILRQKPRRKVPYLRSYCRRIAAALP